MSLEIQNRGTSGPEIEHMCPPKSFKKKEVYVIQPGQWYNGNTFVFCPGDCPFESEPSSTSADACG